MRIAIAGFIVPYMAVFAPELMLQGEWTVLSVLYIVFKAVVAIVLWGATSIGFLGTPLPWPARLFAFAAAATLVAAQPLTDEIGLALAAAFFVLVVLRGRAARQAAGQG